MEMSKSCLWSCFGSLFVSELCRRRRRFVSEMWSSRPREACSCCLPDFEDPKAACLPAEVRSRAPACLGGAEGGFLVEFFRCDVKELVL